MADQYARLAQTILAQQYPGGEDNAVNELQTFVQPALVRYQTDGSALVSTQDNVMLVHPTDWVLETIPGIFERMTDEEFQATYVKM